MLWGPCTLISEPTNHPNSPVRVCSRSGWSQRLLWKTVTPPGMPRTRQKQADAAGTGADEGTPPGPRTPRKTPQDGDTPGRSACCVLEL